MSNFSVTICNWVDLPVSENTREGWRGHRGDGINDWYIVIKQGDKVLRIESDGMEPEDAIFPRDLKWIKDALEDAYELGYQDGEKDGMRP